MAVDAQQAALLVRVTARASAVIVAVNLIVTARRASSPRVRVLRSADLATFAAFLVSHTIHFACVALLANATDGANIRNSGGWPLTLATGLVFYAAAAVVLRVKSRAQSWSSSRQKWTEVAPLIVVWVVFFQAYALRFLDSQLFAALAVVLAYSVAGLLRAALRSQATSISL